MWASVIPLERKRGNVNSLLKERLQMLPFRNCILGISSFIWHNNGFFSSRRAWFCSTLFSPESTLLLFPSVTGYLKWQCCPEVNQLCLRLMWCPYFKIGQTNIALMPPDLVDWGSKRQLSLTISSCLSFPIVRGVNSFKLIQWNR